MRFLTLFSCFLLTANVSVSQRSKDLLPKNVFTAGEYIKLKVIYKYGEVWVQAGHVQFEFSYRPINGKNYLVCIAKGNTTPAFDIIYKVRDEYATVIEPDEFKPKFFFRRVKEGGFRIHNDFDFRHDSLKVIAEMQDSKHPHRVDTLQIDSNTQDIVSAILYCRSLDYSKMDSGEIKKFPIFLDNETFYVGIKYLGRKLISTELSDFNCIVIQPLLLTGRIFAEADQMRIYITDDEYRIPVHIESPLRVGKVMAVIDKYKRP